MGRSFAEELPAHLEEWVREGLISPESAEILLRRNRAEAGVAADAVKRKLLTVLAILCAALLGGGLILVIAHNWDMLSPFWRLSMAYLPLLAGLVFGGFVLRRHDGKPCWCEPAALWIGAAAASAIAIVSQLYQVSGSLNDYLFWLILLCVPQVWLFRSTALALCCSVATVAMAVSGAELIERSFLQTTLFFLLLAPWTLRLALRAAGRWGKLAGQLATLLLLFTLGDCALGKTGGFVGLISWAALFSVLLTGGAELFRREGGGRFGNLFLLAGFGGLAWLVVAGSFREFWGMFREVDCTASGWGWLLFTLALYAAAVGFLCRDRRRAEGGWIAVAAPLLVFCCLLGENPDCSMLLFNIYFAVTGLWMLWYGVRLRQLGWLNGGMLILGAQIFLRFCASGDILACGICFLVLGAALGGVNLVLARKFRREAVQ